MHNWRNASIQRMRDLIRDKGGKEISDDEAIECLENLMSFFEILADWDRKAKGNESKPS